MGIQLKTFAIGIYQSEVNELLTVELDELEVLESPYHTVVP